MFNFSRVCFLGLLFATISVCAAGLSYTDSITVIAENRISPNDNSTGFIEINYASEFENYDLFGADNFVLLTFSTFNYLHKIKALADLALRNGLLGDAFLIYHKIVLNGQVNQTEQTLDSKMTENMAFMLQYSTDKGSKITFADLAGKCSSAVLSKYYYTLQNSTVPDSITRGYVTGVGPMGAHSQDDSQIEKDCMHLHDILASDDVAISPSSLTRKFAWETCCKTYPANSTLPLDQLFDDIPAF